MEKQYFTKDEIAWAKKVDLVDLLSSLGIRMKHHSGDEYILEGHDSLKISRSKGWYWNSRNTGGNSIDFLMHGPDQNYSFTGAVNLILNSSYVRAGDTCGKASEAKASYKAEKHQEGDMEEKEFILPDKNYDNRRVFAYLTKTRGIDAGIVNSCLKSGCIYEAKVTHNAVFIAYDHEGVPRAAFQRGTAGRRFAGDVSGSDKNYGFRIDGDGKEKVHVFEAAIDALSYSTMACGCRDTLLVLNGVSLHALDSYLMHEPATKEIIVRTDSDKAGRSAVKKIVEAYGGQYKVTPMPPKNKDYNEDLLKRLNGEGRMEK